MDTESQRHGGSALSPDNNGTEQQKTDVAIPVGERRLVFWVVILLVLGWLLYALSGFLAPFGAGLDVAYCFDPVADRLERAGFSRGISAGIVIVTFLALATAVVMLLYPLLQSQVMGLMARLPDVVDALRQQVAPLIKQLNAGLTTSDAASLKGAAGKYASGVLTWAAGLLQSLWDGGLAFFNILSLIVITPLVAFYFLRDWDLLVGRFDELLPRSSAETIREQIKIIDDTIAAFVRGQGTVCLVLGIYYAVGLSLAGLDFGLLVGLGTGMLSFIPYLGASIGLTTGLAIALYQFPDLMSVATVAIIFLAGQTAESYVLTPRLIGEKVGLHPVWIIFALLAGGALFGFTGVLLAVPVTAVIGVLVRFSISRYLDSSYYKNDRF